MEKNNKPTGDSVDAPQSDPSSIDSMWGEAKPEYPTDGKNSGNQFGSGWSWSSAAISIISYAYIVNVESPFEVFVFLFSFTIISFLLSWEY